MSISATEIRPTPESQRLISLDAFRGFVMICLAAEGFGFSEAAKRMSNDAFWQKIGYQFSHVPWVGCSFWDLIQPSFMILVGVAMPYSISRRSESGESALSLLRHAIVRSFVLVLLGLFLSSSRSPTTNFTFVNVLTQIGLGYTFLFLLRNRGFLIQAVISCVILGLYWAWFAFSPVVPISSIDDFKTEHKLKQWVLLEGFEAHWQKYKNPAADFDAWFLNLFPPRVPPVTTSPNSDAMPGSAGTEKMEEKLPSSIFESVAAILRRLVTRPEPYVFNAGGYQTLNFIPSFVTMLFGLMAGEFIRRGSFSRIHSCGILFLAGLLLLGLGWGWHAAGGCPLVKRIWTPSWTLFSSGWVLIMLAGFYGVIDGLGWKSWSFPLVVAGMNSMVLYLAGQLLRGWTADLLKRHVNENLFQIFGDNFAPIIEANLVLICFWLFVYWLYRQRIFVKV